MKADRAAVLLGSWLLAIVLVGLVITAADRLAPTDNRYQNQASGVLERGWSSDDPGAVRIAVVGDSFSVSGFGIGDDLEAGLATNEVQATVLNISGPAVTLRDFDPLIEKLLAARPDVILLQADLLWDEPADLGAALRGRLGRWFGSQRQPVAWDRPREFCRQFDSDGLDNVAANNLAASEEQELLRGEIARFVAAVEGRDVTVIVTQPPISDSIRLATLGDRDEWRADALAHIQATGDVVIGPVVEVPEDENYCGFEHLNDAGRAIFLESFSRELAMLLKATS